MRATTVGPATFRVDRYTLTRGRWGFIPAELAERLHHPGVLVAEHMKAVLYTGAKPMTTRLLATGSVEFRPGATARVHAIDAEALCRHPHFRVATLVDQLRGDPDSRWIMTRNGGLGDVIMANVVFQALLQRFPHGAAYCDPSILPAVERDGWRSLQELDQLGDEANDVLWVSLSGYPERLPAPDQTAHRVDLFAKACGVDWEFDRQVRLSWQRNPSPGRVCLLPEARNTARLWHWDRWKALADGLLARGLDVLVAGENGEYYGPDVKRFVGAPMGQFLRFLTTCEVCVGLDSGPMHFCGAVGVPFVALMTTFPTTTRCAYYDSVVGIEMPVSCRCYAYSCSVPGRPCADFPVETVLEAVDALR